MGFLILFGNLLFMLPLVYSEHVEKGLRFLETSQILMWLSVNALLQVQRKGQTLKYMQSMGKVAVILLGSPGGPRIFLRTHVL